MINYKKIICIISAFIISVSLIGCNNSSNIISKNYFCLDTIAGISVYQYDDNTDPEKIIDDAFKLCDRYEQLFSKSIKNTDVSRINNYEKFQPHDETIKIIKDSMEISKLTNSAFDITISPLVDLWNINGGNKIIPTQSKLKSALKTVNYKKINIDKDSVSLKKGTEIDLGGIAKGYIADRIKDYMVSKGVTSAIIDLGGNILTIGNNHGKDFVVGIKKPFSTKSNEYSAKIKITDKSIVTSGIYERYFVKDKKIYHHILDPKSGYPVNNNLNSVTIVSDSSELGDALSTACFVLGIEKGMELINSQKNIEAVFITKDNKLHLSNGLQINNEKTISYK